MDRQKIVSNLFRREVMVSILVVGVASMALGAVTWAQFSDSDTSDGNTVEAGTLDIKLDGGDSQTGVFSLTNAEPGDSTSHDFTLTNAGSAAGNHVEVTLSFSENDQRSEPSDPDLANDLGPDVTARHINVTTLEYRDGSGTVIEDVLSNVNDGNGNGIEDLADVRNQSGSLDDLQPPESNGNSETHLVITVEIADDSGDFTGIDEDVMADGIDVKLTFTLNQDSSQ